jgi:hypothetical protein
MMEVDRCRDIRPHFVEVALGSVDSSAANRIRLHLSEGCPACASELERVLEAYFGIPLAFEPVLLPESAEADLRAAVAKVTQLTDDAAIVYSETNERRLLWTLVALCILSVVAAAWWGNKQVNAVAWAETAQRSAEQQARAMAADYRLVRERLVPAEALATLVADPSAIVVDLYDNGDRARARAVLDWPEKRALIIPPNQPAPPETTFVLWLRSGDSVTRIGPLQLDLDAGPSPHPFALPDTATPGITLELWATPDLEIEADTPTGNRLVTGTAPSPVPSIE